MTLLLSGSMFCAFQNNKNGASVNHNKVRSNVRDRPERKLRAAQRKDCREFRDTVAAFLIPAAIGVCCFLTTAKEMSKLPIKQDDFFYVTSNPLKTYNSCIDEGCCVCGLLCCFWACLPCLKATSSQSYSEPCLKTVYKVMCRD